MTKKMQNLLKKYESKLDAELRCMKLGYSNFEETYKKLSKLEKEFDQLRTQMFYYDLISTKDFKETVSIGYNMFSKAVDKAHNF